MDFFAKKQGHSGCHEDVTSKACKICAKHGILSTYLSVNDCKNMRKYLHFVAYGL